MLDDGSTAARKDRQLQAVLDSAGDDGRLEGGFDALRLPHRALPEISLSEVSTRTVFLGRELGAPLLISCTTGGTPRTYEIIARLARAAQARRLAFGLGSQRVMLESPEAARFFQVRALAPDVPILSNLGAVQLNYGVTVDDCRRLVELSESDALVLHLNPLQEALQEGGNTNFSGLLGKIEALCRQLPVPVIAKEIGYGISGEVARHLVDAGVWGIDVAGAGGTSWSQIEAKLASSPRGRMVGRAFAAWGIPTSRAVVSVRRTLPQVPLIASGGLRDGVDVAKAIALGADMAGIAGPLVKAAAASEEALMEYVDALVQQLRVAMFCTGAAEVPSLRQVEVIWEGQASTY